MPDHDRYDVLVLGGGESGSISPGRWRAGHSTDVIEQKLMTMGPALGSVIDDEVSM